MKSPLPIIALLSLMLVFRSGAASPTPVPPFSAAGYKFVTLPTTNAMRNYLGAGTNGGSQTPWLSAINGNGKQLTNANLYADTWTNGTADSIALYRSAGFAFPLYGANGSPTYFDGLGSFLGSFSGDALSLTNFAASNLVSGGQIPVGTLFAATTNGNTGGFLLETINSTRYRTFNALALTNLSGSNITGGGVLPIGTLSSASPTAGNVLSYDGSNRTWTNRATLQQIDGGLGASNLLTINGDLTVNTQRVTKLRVGGAAESSDAVGITGTLTASDNLTSGNNLQAASGSAIRWNTRSGMYSPINGMIALADSGGTKFTSLLFGPATVVGTLYTSTNYPALFMESTTNWPALSVRIGTNVNSGIYGSFVASNLTASAAVIATNGVVVPMPTLAATSNQTNYTVSMLGNAQIFGANTNANLTLTTPAALASTTVLFNCVTSTVDCVITLPANLLTNVNLNLRVTNGWVRALNFYSLDGTSSNILVSDSALYHR